MAERAEWTLTGFGDEIDPDPQIQVAVLKALGCSYVEVRGAWGMNIADLGDDQVDALSKLLQASSMGVSALASPIGKVDVAGDPESEVLRLRRVIRIAHALGTPNIRVFSFFRAAERTPEEIRDDVLVRMRALANLAEREHIVLLHENEKAIYGDVPERILDLIESVASPALRLVWDNANFVQVGVRPYDAYRLLRPYVDYLHVKDARASTGTVVPAGHGDGQLKETLMALRDDGYRGFASLEPHMASAFELGGFSGPGAFGTAARAFAAILSEIGVGTR
jgi:sugar phosphate isomerase/epimerase